MRLGPIDINLSSGRKADVQMANKDIAPPVLGGELGGTGSIVFNSQLMEKDYNEKFDANRYTIIDQMRMGDGQVKAGLMAIKLPLMRSVWKFEPADDSALQKEIAAHLTEKFLTQCRPYSWHQTLYQILLHLDYGSMPFELVWELDKDRKISLARLAPRLPKSITQWYVNRDGTFGGITQSVWTGKANQVEQVRIPGEKMLLFVNDLEGANFKGISILRAAYPHWFYKNGLYKVDAIAKEKRSIGVDVITLSGAVDETRRLSAESAAMRLNAHEKQFFTEIEGEHTYRVEGIQGSVADALSSIEHHDIRILRSILAEFIAMGERSARGSEAMHRDKTSFFVMAMEAIGQQVTDPVNHFLIPQWVDYNWPGVKEYPRFTHGRLEKRDMQQMAGAVARLVSVGALIADEPLEQTLRERLDFPELEPGTERPDIFALRESERKRS